MASRLEWFGKTWLDEKMSAYRGHSDDTSCEGADNEDEVYRLH